MLILSVCHVTEYAVTARCFFFKSFEVFDPVIIFQFHNLRDLIL